jgi:hypothetical protein
MNQRSKLYVKRKIKFFMSRVRIKDHSTSTSFFNYLSVLPVSV